MAQLPLTRVRTIMKSCDSVQVVSKDSTLLVARAASRFIAQLAQEAMQKNPKPGKKKLDYKDLATVVNSSSRYEFLKEMIPQKIKVRDFKAMMVKKAPKAPVVEISDDERSEASSDSEGSSRSGSSSESSGSSDSESSEEENPNHLIAENKKGGLVEIIEIPDSDDDIVSPSTSV